MLHLDLFSGIGGFAYAVDQVWENAEHIFCDNDKFCQQVLRKHWPNSKIYEDIRQITMENYLPKGFGQGEKNGQNNGSDRSTSEKNLVTDTTDGGWRKSPKSRGGRTHSSGLGDRPSTDLLTGGFPCQPFSQAGRRKGTSDDRFLWPEMLRLIRLTKPRWVIGENVAGLLTIQQGVVFEQVCLDLEAEGYEVQPFIIPAVAVNAPHRRDRVWIVGYCKSKRLERHTDTDKKQERRKSSSGSDAQASWGQDWLEVATRLCGVFNGLSEELDKDMNDVIYSKYAKTFKSITRQDLPCLWKGIQSESFQGQIGRFNTIQNKDYLFTVLWKYSDIAEGQNDLPFESQTVQDAYLRNVWINEKSGRTPQRWEYQEQYAGKHSDSLSQLSHEVALATKEVWENYNLNRVDRLKALGNAIVPQVAIEIMKGIKFLTP